MKAIKFTQQWDYHITHNVIIYEGKNYLCSYQLEESSDYNTLTSVYVSEQNRGGGLGNMMMEMVIDDCIKRNYNDVVLKVKRDNTKAIKLYESFGFNPIDDENTERYIWMKKEIKQIKR